MKVRRWRIFKNRVGLSEVSHNEPTQRDGKFAELPGHLASHWRARNLIAIRALEVLRLADPPGQYDDVPAKT